MPSKLFGTSTAARKVAAGALAGAITTIFVWIANTYWGLDIPGEVGAAITTILTFLVGVLVPPVSEDLGGAGADSTGPGGGVDITIPKTVNTNMPVIPMVLPEAALAIPLMLAPFTAFVVMFGLHWSIKSKGTIGSIVYAAGCVLGIVGAMSLCGFALADSAPVFGAVVTAFSPVNLVLAVCFPEDQISESLRSSVGSGRTALVVGAAIAGAVYIAITIALHTTMKRNFMMTVRKLAGAN